MAEYDIVSLSLCLISLLVLGICLLAIFLSYRRFKLSPILYYFFAFAFFLLGILGIIPSTLILDTSQEEFITFTQAYTFGLTFIGMFFLLLAISCAKGALLT